MKNTVGRGRASLPPIVQTSREHDRAAPRHGRRAGDLRQGELARVQAPGDVLCLPGRGAAGVSRCTALLS
jgi:hypothetical protein